MKKCSLMCTLVFGACLTLPTMAMAQMIDLANASPRGFSAEQESKLTTVAGVFNNAYDGYLVTLQGRLTEYLGHEHYKFSDATGSIEVELDDDHDWSHLSKDELIQIIGVVDSSLFSTRIDVKQAFPLETAQSQPRSATPVHHRDFQE